MPAWRNGYLEGHVGRVDHAEEGDADVREDAGAQRDEGDQEECEDEVAGPQVGLLGEALDWGEVVEGGVDAVEERVGEVLCAVQHCYTIY